MLTGSQIVVLWNSINRLTVINMHYNLVLVKGWWCCVSEELVSLTNITQRWCCASEELVSLTNITQRWVWVYIDAVELKLYTCRFYCYFQINAAYSQLFSVLFLHILHLLLKATNWFHTLNIFCNQAPTIRERIHLLQLLILNEYAARYAITLVLSTLMSRLFLRLTQSRRSTRCCSSASKVANRMTPPA